MSQLMQRLLYPYMAPAGKDGADNGGDDDADRGDDFEPTGDDKGGKKDDPDLDDDEADEGEDEASETDEEIEDKKVAKGDDDDDKKKPVVEDKTKGPKMIPKARFNELNDKAKALQARVDELTKAAQKVEETKTVKEIDTTIEKIELEVEALQADGKNKEALEKMREIRTLERERTAMQTTELSAKATATAVEQVRFDNLVAELEKAYPELDPDHDDYNEATVEEVEMLRSAFEAKGFSSSKALGRAVKYVLTQNVTGPGAEKDEGKKGLRDKGGDRKQKAVARNLKDAKKIPPTQDGADSDKKGGGIDGKSLPDMTEEEFDALPESTKARMRGDLFEAA